MIESFVIAAPRQRREALLAQHLAHGGGTQGRAVLFEGLADLIHRMVLLAQSDYQVVRLGLVRLGARTVTGRREELRMGLTTELVAQHAEGSRGVAESAGDLVGGAVLNEEGAQGFVLALVGMGGFGEESPDFCYVFRYAYTHTYILVYKTMSRQRKSH